MKAVVLHSVVPVRAEQREGSEQLTQLLFGQICNVLEVTDHWTKVTVEEDGQTGWVDAKMVTPMSDKEYKSYQKGYQSSSALVQVPMTYALSENNGQTIPLVAGTRLPGYEKGRFTILGVSFRVDSSMVAEQVIPLDQAHLLQVTRFFINTPYLWGGKNALGMDCSGFTQVVLSLFGKHLLRNASEQVQQGRRITHLTNAKPGDLAFFDHEDGRISHVGILLDSERIIHCSGRVKVERVDEKGIWSTERADQTHPKGLYTHHLVCIRRY